MSVAVRVEPPKTSASVVQSIAHRLGPDLAGLDVDDAAAADAEREHVGHPEVRADAGDFHLVGGFTGETVDEQADVGCRSADVDRPRTSRARS